MFIFLVDSGDDDDDDDSEYDIDDDDDDDVPEHGRPETVIRLENDDESGYSSDSSFLNYCWTLFANGANNDFF